MKLQQNQNQNLQTLYKLSEEFNNIFFTTFVKIPHLKHKVFLKDVKKNIKNIYGKRAIYTLFKVKNKGNEHFGSTHYHCFIFIDSVFKEFNDNRFTSKIHKILDISKIHIVHSKLYEKFDIKTNIRNILNYIYKKHKIFKIYSNIHSKNSDNIAIFGGYYDVLVLNYTNVLKRRKDYKYIALFSLH